MTQILPGGHKKPLARFFHCAPAKYYFAAAALSGEKENEKERKKKTTERGRIIKERKEGEDGVKIKIRCGLSSGVLPGRGGDDKLFSAKN